MSEEQGKHKTIAEMASANEPIEFKSAVPKIRSVSRSAVFAPRDWFTRNRCALYIYIYIYVYTCINDNRAHAGHARAFNRGRPHLLQLCTLYVYKISQWLIVDVATPPCLKWYLCAMRTARAIVILINNKTYSVFQVDFSRFLNYCYIRK